MQQNVYCNKHKI